MIINLTPCQINIYANTQFTNLDKWSDISYVADGVVGKPIASYHTVGVCRMDKTEQRTDPVDGIPMFDNICGECSGIPDNVQDDDILVVHVCVKSAALWTRHPLAKQMVSPYREVRDRADTFLILGCMGFIR